MILLSVFISLGALVALAAVIYPFRPFPSRGRALIVLLGLGLLNGIIVTNSTPKERVNTKRSTVNPITPSLDVKSPVAEKAASADNWSYDSATDQMTGAVRHWACTVSTNELQFSFPYDGGATGTLCFIRKGKTLNATVQVSTGQFNCDIDDCALRFKFDNGAIQSFSAEESTTHETGVLFLNSEQRLLSDVVKAKELKVEAEYFEEGTQVLTFEVTGLNATRL